ncbi:MAG: histidine kinase dimerization/phosphoacceptor domain-containing protein [Hydrogenibacillus schlegelii]|nr:histidine kinase dimerization/phosphoacceptor domain-containing protein [Hydrogenibacillus schlegelii]
MLLVQEAMRAEVEERRRSARELHDEIGQRIYSFFVLQSIEPAVEEDPVRERLERFSLATEKALRRVRRLGQLRPSMPKSPKAGSFEIHITSARSPPSIRQNRTRSPITTIFYMGWLLLRFIVRPNKWSNC